MCRARTVVFAVVALSACGSSDAIDGGAYCAAWGFALASCTESLPDGGSEAFDAAACEQGFYSSACTTVDQQALSDSSYLSCLSQTPVCSPSTAQSFYSAAGACFANTGGKVAVYNGEVSGVTQSCEAATF